MRLNSDPDRQPAFLSYGFRPFFLLAGLYAALAIAAWAGWLLIHDIPGVMVTPTFSVAPHHWHGHEMIHGFAVAVISGFMLTAVPSWTGARRIAGTPLLALALLWLAGRLAMWFSAALPVWLVAAADLAYLPVFAAMVVGGLMVRPAPRNLVFLVFLLLLAAANGFIHAEWAGLAHDMASRALSFSVHLLALMVALIGGRIIPGFTRNALIMREPGAVLPRSFAWLDRMALGLLAALAACVALGIGGWIAGVLAAGAALAHLARLSFWRGGATLRTPLLWSLHLAYGLLGVALAAIAMAHVTDWIAPSAAQHLMAIGGIGGMTLAVMTRAALGHTGRPLVVGRMVALTYGLIAAAALVRSIAPELFPRHYMTAILLAAVLWAAGFILFAIIYFPVLTGPSIPKRGA